MRHRNGKNSATRERAQFEKEMAILGADKRAAIANAKLKVFKDAFLEEELGKDFELLEFRQPQIKTEERTSQWVHSSPLLDFSPTGNLSHQEFAPSLLNCVGRRETSVISTPQP